MATYTPLQSITLNASATSLTFTNIPQTYTDLVLVQSVKGVGSSSSGQTEPDIYFNGDTSSNYSLTQILGNGSSVLSTRTTSSNIGIAVNYTDQNQYATSITHILSYTNTSLYKTALTRWSNMGSSDSYAAGVIGLWRSYAAINAIRIYARTNSNSFDAGST